MSHSIRALSPKSNEISETLSSSTIIWDLGNFERRKRERAKAKAGGKKERRRTEKVISISVIDFGLSIVHTDCRSVNENKCRRKIGELYGYTFEKFHSTSNDLLH